MRGSVGDTYFHHGRLPTVLNDNTTKLRTALYTTIYPDPFRLHQNFQASDRIRKYFALLFSAFLQRMVLLKQSVTSLFTAFFILPAKPKRPT